LSGTEGRVEIPHNAPRGLRPTMAFGHEGFELGIADFDERELRRDEKPLSSTSNGTAASCRIVIGISLLFMCRKRSLAICVGVETQPPWPTLQTEFTPPNGLGTASVACGSGVHWPSTTRQYS